MSEDDVLYFRRRAEAELANARRAQQPEVERVHAELANAYLNRIAADEPVSRVGHG